MHGDTQSASGRSSGPSALGALAFVARVLEASVVVFTRTRFGERYLGIHALAVIPWAFVFASYCGEQSGSSYGPYGFGPQASGSQAVDGLMTYLAVWFVAFVCARLDVMSRARRGDTEHSYYGGHPWLFRKANERNAKSCYEPFLIFVIGLITYEYNPPVGQFIMFGAAGVFVSSVFTQAQERQRLTDLRDAQLEQRYLAERFRENQWR